MPFNGPWNQTMGCQHSPEAVEHCLCSGTAPCMPASAPWCPAQTLSKGALWPPPEKHIGTRGCAPARDGVGSTAVPTAPWDRAQALHAWGWSAKSPSTLEALAGRYLYKHDILWNAVRCNQFPCTSLGGPSALYSCHVSAPGSTGSSALCTLNLLWVIHNSRGFHMTSSSCREQMLQA